VLEFLEVYCPVLAPTPEVVVPFSQLLVMFMCSGMTSMHLPVRQDALKCLDIMVRFLPEVFRAPEHVAQILPNYRILLAASKSTGNSTYKGGVNWNLASYSQPHLLSLSPSAKKAKKKKNQDSQPQPTQQREKEQQGKDVKWRMVVAQSLSR
jgi:hypothetical protein